MYQCMHCDEIRLLYLYAHIIGVCLLGFFSRYVDVCVRVCARGRGEQLHLSGLAIFRFLQTKGRLPGECCVLLPHNNILVMALIVLICHTPDKSSTFHA